MKDKAVSNTWQAVHKPMLVWNPLYSREFEISLETHRTESDTLEAPGKAENAGVRFERERQSC